ncbi:MAG: nicotinate-nucleotide adenylyltransferase [Christensenellales bacterium]
MREYTEFSHFELDCMQLKQNRVGLLGGTFNPIHNGHLAMAYIALYEFLLGEVIFLPVGIPPHKKGEHIAPCDLRLDMINIAIADEKRFSVNTLELSRKGYTYTVDTLEILTRENKNTEYYYIIGADTLFELNTWKNFERVVFLTNFICILRPGQDDDRVKKYVDEINNKFGYKFFIANDKGPNISSSFVRALAIRNKLTAGFVPDNVARYLMQNRVYFKED